MSRPLIVFADPGDDGLVNDIERHGPTRTTRRMVIATEEEILAQPCVVAALQRLHDLVRHQRSDLHEAGLISDEEYVALAADHGAVARLETYDAVVARAKIAREQGWEQGFADACAEDD